LKRGRKFGNVVERLACWETVGKGRGGNESEAEGSGVDDDYALILTLLVLDTYPS
jgi:hypothetical protein